MLIHVNVPRNETVLIARLWSLSMVTYVGYVINDDSLKFIEFIVYFITIHLPPKKLFSTFLVL